MGTDDALDELAGGNALTPVPEYARPLVMLATAAIALVPTFAAWHAAVSVAEREAEQRFRQRSEDISALVRSRMLDYEQALRGAAGLFAASREVEAPEWAAYVDAVRIERAYPGIQGLGYAPYVQTAQGAEVRILFLLPLDERNRRAIGFDMYSEPMRRRAMDHARDTGEPAVTAPVTLVQESGVDPQAGFLMYLPVYRNGVHVATPQERRHALGGFVYAPFRARDLMKGILGSEPGVAVGLADVTPDGSPTVLLDATAGQAEKPRYHATETIALHGREWRLETASLPAFEAQTDTARPRLILAGGLAISALLLLIVWSLLTTRERARALARDMTAALRASEERLQTALASSHVALFDWDVTAGLVHLSAEWSVMLGGPAQPLLTPIQKLELLVHPDDAAEVKDRAATLVDGKTDAYRIEHRVRRNDGSWKWIESSARVNERGPDGRARRITGANSDIDERKALERMKSEFIATVSHELRTPLTSMVSSLALLREGSAGELPADARRFVDIAYANSERLAELINNILDLERVEAGRLELQPVPLELRPLLERAITLNAAFGARLHVTFVLAIPDAGLRVLADPERLMQVLTNLLSNAAKHSPRGGEVQVAAADAATGVRISVSDRGAGIPAEFRARLFGKFEQADASSGGSGLGLAISKALMEAMQGRIGCDSEPGQGSTFWVELPKP